MFRNITWKLGSIVDCSNFGALSRPLFQIISDYLIAYTCPALYTMSEDPTMGGKVSPLLEEGEIKSEEDAVCPGTVCKGPEKEGAGVEQSDDDEGVDVHAEADNDEHTADGDAAV